MLHTQKPHRWPVKEKQRLVSMSVLCHLKCTNAAEHKMISQIKNGTRKKNIYFLTIDQVLL